MAIRKITIKEFLEYRTTHLVLDVRSPSEYAHAHILNAVSLPLFSDEERKVVGTAYKKQSREEAIKIGLDYFGVKMRRMVEEVELLTKERENNKLIVHCWRGGMRSAAIAWLLDLYGFDVAQLVGGYKAYRRWANQLFEQSHPIHILSGYTGSGKTSVLQQLVALGKNVIDLEGLAKHKGSSFGWLKDPQPSQEMFENKLAESLRKIEEGKPIWIEDESQRIGNLNVPPKLWRTMRNAPVFLMDVPFEERLKYIVEEYGEIQAENLIEATIRIQKRLGGLETKNCIAYLEEGNILEAFRILLKYYDKQYQKALQKRNIQESIVEKIDCVDVDAATNTKKILACLKKK